MRGYVSPRCWRRCDRRRCRVPQARRSCFVAAAVRAPVARWRVRPAAGTNGAADRCAATTAHRSSTHRRQTALDAKALLRGGGTSSADGAFDGAWSAAAVDDPPALLAGPRSPTGCAAARWDRSSGARAGRDRHAGRAEPGSMMLQSSHAGFEAAARMYVLRALFRPGRALAEPYGCWCACRSHSPSADSLTAGRRIG